MTTFPDYARRVGLAAMVNPTWRYGQAAFNVLCNMRPELAAEVRGTDLDPFSDNERLPEFWAFVEREW